MVNKWFRGRMWYLGPGLVGQNLIVCDWVRNICCSLRDGQLVVSLPNVVHGCRLSSPETKFLLLCQKYLFQLISRISVVSGPNVIFGCRLTVSNSQ